LDFLNQKACTSPPNNYQKPTYKSNKKNLDLKTRSRSGIKRKKKQVNIKLSRERSELLSLESQIFKFSLSSLFLNF
jgi:hypothetical protein